MLALKKRRTFPAACRARKRRRATGERAGKLPPEKDEFKNDSCVSDEMLIERLGDHVLTDSADDLLSHLTIFEE